MNAPRWYVDTYRDAVWESANLKAEAKAVAEVYARHARDSRGVRSATADLAWVTYPRLMQLAGIRRRENVSEVLETLEKAGWLTVVKKVPRRPTDYRLTIPEGEGNHASSDGGTTEHDRNQSGSSDGGTTDQSGSSSPSSNGGTTVVPGVDHGSSDGGTPPLAPQKPPLSPDRPSGSPTGERESATPNTNPKTSPGHTALATRGITGAEADRLVPVIEARNNVKMPRAWWLFVAGNGTLDGVIADARAFVSNMTTPAAQASPEQAEYAQLLAEGPECPHGIPAGAIIRPQFGTSRCPQCRRVAAATERTPA
jgi:hypothetical protein